jgi:hypothetical protein
VAGEHASIDSFDPRRRLSSVAAHVIGFINWQTPCGPDLSG